MNRITTLLCTAVFGAGLCGANAIEQFTGSLTEPSGLETSAGWAGSTFSWDVTDTAAGLSPGWWRYTYSWTFDSPNISHFIIEVSPNVSRADFGNFVGIDLDLSDGIDLYGEGSGNPGIPGDVYGFKVNLQGDSLTFDSTRAPVWGDFYAKGGNDDYAYNRGFLNPDPNVPPVNGSIDNKILRPDTTTTVPEGGATLALLGISLAALGILSRRNRS